MAKRVNVIPRATPRKVKVYRGRDRRRKPVLLVVLCVLLAVALLLAALFFIFPDFIVHINDGGVRIEWPWDKKPPAAEPAVSPSVPVVIIETPTPPPSPTPPVEEEKPRSLWVPMADLGDVEKLEGLKALAVENGINDIVVEIKNKNTDKSKADAEVLTATVEFFKDSGLTLTAAFPVFLDNETPFMKPPSDAVVIKKNGVNWIDSNRDRWLDAHEETTRRYVIDYVLWVKKQGFERMLLQNVSFPYTGSPAAYKPEGRMESISLFLDELADAADGLWLAAVVADETISQGVYELAGQSLEKFEETFDTLYYEVTSETLAPLEKAIPILAADMPELDGWLAEGEKGYLILSADGKYTNLTSEP